MKNLLVIAPEDGARGKIVEYLEQMSFKPICISDPFVCQALKTGDKKCSNQVPCANILLVDNDLPEIDGLSILAEQGMNGCQISPDHKALMVKSISDVNLGQVGLVGCHLIEKPVTENNLGLWLANVES